MIFEHGPFSNIRADLIIAFSTFHSSSAIYPLDSLLLIENFRQYNLIRNTDLIFEKFT